MRSLNRSKIKDMISISSLLEKFKMLSVNQLNAKVKLMEIWKAKNVADYLLKVEHQQNNSHKVNTRADIKERPIEIGVSSLTQKTCVSDAIHLWNLAPDLIKNTTSLYHAKSEIKKFVAQLPI